MATSKLAILIETLYKGKGAKMAAKDIRSLDDVAGAAQDTLGDLVKVGAGVAAGFVAMGYAAKQGLDFLEEGGKINQMSQAFKGLAESLGQTFDTMMGALRDATRGMIDDMTRMNTANCFVSMGLSNTAEETAKLAEIAVTLGMAMGKEAGPAMEEFGLLLANTSTLRLDTFGISAGKVKARIKELADEFPEMTRETAFMTATMEQAEISMGKVGDMAVNSASVIKAEFTNNINELKANLAEDLMPVLADLSENLLPQVAAAFVDITPKAIKMGKGIINSVTLASTTYDWNLLRNQLIELGASWGDVNDIVDDGRAKFRLFRNAAEMDTDLRANERGMLRMGLALEGVNQGLEVGSVELERYVRLGEWAGDVNQRHARELEGVEVATDGVTEATEEVAAATSNWDRAQSTLNSSLMDSWQRMGDVAIASGPAADGIEDVGDEAESATPKIDALNAKLRGLEDELRVLSGLEAIHLEFEIGTTEREIARQQEGMAETFGTPDVRGIPEFAHGGSFTVPPGFESKPYYIGVHSGEPVTVTPKGQQSAGGGGLTIINHFATGNPDVITRRITGQVADQLGVRG